MQSIASFLISRRAVRWMIFPGFWILGFPVLWLGHFEFPTLISIGLGAVTYLARYDLAGLEDTKPYLHPAVAIVSIVFASMIVPATYGDIVWDPLARLGSRQASLVITMIFMESAASDGVT